MRDCLKVSRNDFTVSVKREVNERSVTTPSLDKERNTLSLSIIALELIVLINAGPTP